MLSVQKVISLGGSSIDHCPLFFSSRDVIFLFPPSLSFPCFSQTSPSNLVDNSFPLPPVSDFYLKNIICTLQTTAIRHHRLEKEPRLGLSSFSRLRFVIINKKLFALLMHADVVADLFSCFLLVAPHLGASYHQSRFAPLVFNHHFTLGNSSTSTFQITLIVPGSSALDFSASESLFITTTYHTLPPLLYHTCVLRCLLSLLRICIYCW